MNLERKVTVRLDPDRLEVLDGIPQREGFTVSIIVTWSAASSNRNAASRSTVMTEIARSTTSAKAHPLPDRFQALYGQIPGLDPFSRDSFLDFKVTAA